jgi:hypothetical protein
MAASGFFLIVGVIALGVFVFGCWIGARSFESTTSKVVAGILCGLGAVAIAAGIAFGGCLLLLSNSNFH